MPSSADATDRRPGDVAVVIVTYGDRAHLVQRVVDRVRSEGAGLVILVDNGSVGDGARYVRELASREDVQVLRAAENLGSAGGYARGLRAALASTAPYFWLLDDDNLPDRGCLAALLRTHAALTEGPEASVVLACHRRAIARKWANAPAHGGDDPSPLPPESNFLGFHVRDLLRKFAPSRPRTTDGETGATRPAHRRVRRAPYGGLFLPREVVERVGTPDEDFFLYGDDTEYTLRVARSGSVIHHVFDAGVADLDASWDANEAGGRAVDVLLASPSDDRVFYSVRNGTFITLHRRDADRRTYAINKWIYLSILGAVALRRGRLRRWRLIVNAAAAGEAGRLGRRNAA